MKIEVFKDYGQALRHLDGTWSFDSENHRDGPTSPPYRRGLGNPEYNEAYINELGPEARDREGTIYLSSDSAGCKVYSTQENIVIDTKIPYIRSMSGTYTAFLKKEVDLSHSSGSRALQNIQQIQRTNWHLEFQVKDDSGIDGEAYDLFDGTILGENRVFFSYSRKNENSREPYWFSERTAGFEWTNVHVKVEQSSVDNTVYSITIDIDPSGFFNFNEDGSIESKKADAPVYQCNEHFWYMKLGVRFFDIAGNVIEDTLDKAFVIFTVTKEDLLADIQRLKLSFSDTYPPNMLVTKDILGHTTIVVDDPNEALRDYGFTAKIGLLDGSVGYLSGEVEQDDNDTNTFTQLVDGIDQSGFVKAYAYLDGMFGNVSCSIGADDIEVTIDKDFATELKALTYVEGELGRFIVECDSNRRKLYIDPFVPSVLKAEGFYGLCKLFEQYLNTMYTPMSGDCRIGVLEKIDRISHFKDPDTCEPELLPRFAEEHGSELKFNHDDVKRAAEILQKYLAEDYNTEDLIEQIYRRYYSILPYIDRWKGTDTSIYLIFRVLGIDAEVIPLWEGPNGDLVPEEKAGDDYRLSSHIQLKLTSGSIYQRDMVALSNFAIKAVKSILPITRVISDVRAEDEAVSDGHITITIIKSGESYSQNDEKILFAWLYKEVQAALNCGSFHRIGIDAYPADVHVGHSAADSESYPVPRYAGFYFARLREYMNTYKTDILNFTFAEKDGEEFIKPVNVKFKVKNISIKKNKIVLDVDGAGSDITKYNTNITDPTKHLTIGFRFARHLENYCEPMTLTQYQSLDASTVPIEDQDEN